MAIFLTSLDILDTGFLTVSSRTNQLSSSYRANSGNELRLKGISFDITSSGSLDESVTPGYDPDDIKGHEKRAFISVNPIEINLSIVLNADNTDTNNVWGINDVALLAELLRLPQTKGWKALYYPVDNTATDVGSNSSRKRNSQIVYQLGETDTSEDQGDIDLTL